MSRQPHNGHSVIWCGALRPQDLNGKVPAGYTYALPGVDKKPGLYGEGFGGEAIVCLLPGDDGQWFRDICKQRDTKGEWEIYFHAESQTEAIEG